MFWNLSRAANPSLLSFLYSTNSTASVRLSVVGWLTVQLLNSIPTVVLEQDRELARAQGGNDAMATGTITRSWTRVIRRIVRLSTSPRQH